MKKKKALSADDLYNGWLTPYHGITVAWLMENEPELIKTSDWYKKYAVTEEQHDIWYEWAVDELCKAYGYKSKKSRELMKRRFAVEYLNIAPSIIKAETT
jgi:hypothetical protein